MECNNHYPLTSPVNTHHPDLLTPQITGDNSPSPQSVRTIRVRDATTSLVSKQGLSLVKRFLMLLSDWLIVSPYQMISFNQYEIFKVATNYMTVTGNDWALGLVVLFLISPPSTLLSLYRGG